VTRKAEVIRPFPPEIVSAETLADRMEARQRRRPTKRELARAVEVLLAAGLQIASIRIEPDGTILVIPGTPPRVPSSPSANPWDGAL
jgi:hypothetical protein